MMKQPNWWTLTAVSFFAALGISSYVAAADPTPVASAGGEYTEDGAGTCADCHEDLAAAFPNALHSKAWAALDEKYQAKDCETCHGPGAAHVDSEDMAMIISFGSESHQDAEEKTAVCLKCHADTPDLALWDMGAHARNDVTCADCHDIHAGSRPEANQPTVCFTCHRDVRSDAYKQSHHPIVEGKVSCNDCHNPHGSLSDGMIRAESRNQLCYTCHAEKRGPFIFEHPPVAEDCGICHEPHGSRHNRLLTEKVPNLCQDCHDWSRHPGTPYAGNNGFRGSSPSSRFFGRSCLNCHSRIHGGTGSDNPDNGYNAAHKFTR